MKVFSSPTGQIPSTVVPLWSSRRNREVSTVRLAYMVIEPFVYPAPAEGGAEVAGIDVELWSVIGKHIGIQVELVNAGDFRTATFMVRYCRLL